MSLKNKLTASSTTEHLDTGRAPATAAPPPMPEGSPTEFADCFHAVEHELHALPVEQLEVFNVDVASAVTIERGARPRRAELRRALAALATVTDFDFALVEKLPLYSGALWYAHVQCISRPQPPQSAAALAQECDAHLTVLEVAAKALCNGKLLTVDTLQGLRAEKGYKPLALDTSRLVEALRKDWYKFVGSTALRAAEIDAAALSVKRLLDAVAKRDAFDKEASDALELRQRAFTLFFRAYNEAQRGAGFLRWHPDDAGDYTPALYRGRVRRLRKPSVAPSKPAPEPSKPVVAAASEPAGNVAAPKDPQAK